MYDDGAIKPTPETNSFNTTTRTAVSNQQDLLRQHVRLHLLVGENNLQMLVLELSLHYHYYCYSSTKKTKM